MRVVKQIGKILGWTFLSLVSICLLLYGFLQIPAVQQKLKDMVLGKVSEIAGVHISVDKIYPIFWSGVNLEGVEIWTDANDTILSANTIYATIDKLRLDSSYVAVKDVYLSKPTIRVEKNEQGIFNIDPILKLFQSSDTTSHFKFELHNITIRDAHCVYRDLTAEQQQNWGVNFNNVDVSKLYLYAHNLSVVDGNISLLIDKCSFDEQSGFSVHYLGAGVHVCDTVIRCDNLALCTQESKIFADRFEMRYGSYNDFSDFCNNVELYADLNRTTTSLHDISYFAPQLVEYPYSFSVEGMIQGTVSDISAQDFHIGYGLSTQFVGDVALKGLPDIDKTHFLIRANTLCTNPIDVSQTRIPPYSEENYVELPSMLKSLMYYGYRGNVEGYLDNFQAKGRILTDIGTVDIDAQLKQNQAMYCNGTVAVDDFDLSKVLTTDVVGKLTGEISVEGSFNSDSLISATVVGNIERLECNSYSYSAIDIDGKLSARRFLGKINIADPNLKMNFGGGVDLSKTIPEFRFGANVERANLDKLNLFNDTSSVLSFSTTVDFVGSQLDDMNGDVSIRNLRYANPKGEVSTKNIALNLSNENNKRTISLSSAFVDASVEGDGNYKDLFDAVYNVVQKHITCLESHPKRSMKLSDFNMNVDIRQLNSIFSLLESDVRIAENTNVNAVFNSKDTTCVIAMKSPKITYGNVNLYDCDVFASCSDSALSTNIRASLDSLQISKESNQGNLVNLVGSVRKNLINLNTSWSYDVTSINTYGDLSLSGKMIPKGVNTIPKFELHTSPNDIIRIADSTWYTENATIVIDTTSIAISNFGLFKGNKKILVDGTVSENPDDYVVINVQNYDLQELNPIINNPNVRLAGPIEGRVRVKNVYVTPLAFADIQSPLISFNDNELGTLQIRSFWDNKHKALLANMSIQNQDNPTMVLDGKYIPNIDSIHCDVSFNELNLNVFSELLQGIVNDMKGTVKGDIDIDGHPENLNYSGQLDITDGSMEVDYTHVPYNYSGKLKARKTRFYFTDFEIIDQSNNKGNMVGYIDLKSLPNIEYLFDIQTPKMLVLKTTSQENDYFYGTVWYNGSAKIEGDLNETNISGVGKTLENTICSIPVSYSELTGAYDFLLFSADTAVEKTIQEQTTTSGISIDFTIDVTPDAQAQIIFDPTVGDVIKARGAGNLHLKMDNGGDLKLYGKYQIEEGDYLFTLKNLINKKLIIQKGGTINWNGDPLNGQVNLIANYETKASPQPLFDSTVNATKRIPVTCQVNLLNNLLSPDISYDIVVPSSATQASEILSTLSEDEKTLQFFSLLLQSSFMSLNSTASVGSSVSFEVLSNQFNNLLSQIDPNMDVSVNYRMGTDNTTNNEFEFGISRQFWNDRILVNVNGYTDFGNGNGTESTSANMQSGEFSSNVSVEMKLNKQGTMRVKGFSRSNDDELSEKQENTNGIGFSLTKDFNTLKELFSRKKDE